MKPAARGGGPQAIEEGEDGAVLVAVGVAPDDAPRQQVLEPVGPVGDAARLATSAQGGAEQRIDLGDRADPGRVGEGVERDGR